MGAPREVLKPKLRFDPETNSWVEDDRDYDAYAKRRRAKTSPDIDLIRPPAVKTLFKIETAPLFSRNANGPASVPLATLDETRRYICHLESAAEEHARLTCAAENECQSALLAAVVARREAATLTEDVVYHKQVAQNLNEALAREWQRVTALQDDIRLERKGLIVMLERLLPMIGEEPDWSLDRDRERAEVQNLIGHLKKQV